MGVGDRAGIGGAVDGEVERHLRGRQELAVDDVAVEVDDGHLLGPQAPAAQARGRGGHQVAGAGRQVARRAGHQPGCRQPVAGGGDGGPELSEQQRSEPPASP